MAEPGRLLSMGVTKSRTRLSDFTFTFTVTCCLSDGSPPNARDARETGSIPGLGVSPGVGNGNPLQYSFLENSMDRGAWQTALHGITKSWTQLSHTHTHTHTHTNLLYSGILVASDKNPNWMSLTKKCYGKEKKKNLHSCDLEKQR